MRFAGKVAVVTGGTTGIGFAVSRQLIAEGASVTVTGQDPLRVAVAAEQLGPGGRVVESDVRSTEALERLFREVGDRHDQVDILFANAGIAIPGMLGTVTPSAFDEMVAVNARGVFFTVQAALPYLRPGASVILNASINADTGMPGMSAYAATKAAVRAMGTTMAIELAPRGIRVNTISPGSVDTPAAAKTGMSRAVLDEMLKGIAGQIPLGRIADPEEIAKAVLFLASGDASFVAGSNLVIDGGRSKI